MAIMDIEIEGYEQLEAAIGMLPFLIQRRIQGAGCAAMARVVAANAKQLVPVRTGALRATIRVRRVGERTSRGRVPGAAANVYAGGPGARHSGLVEFGTARTQAQPYLRPALSMRQGEQHRRFAEAISRAFERTVRELASGTPGATLTRLATQ
ncbi:MAG: HK97 gp10 family phage protein [Alphaproteobacteria bacterium]|nr:HK97 gp10 family phage protein [Alphaproteobacteria bacterium]